MTLNTQMRAGVPVARNTACLKQAPEPAAGFPVLGFATKLDLAEYARLQCRSDGETVTLVAADSGNDPDTVILAFQSHRYGQTTWFSGLLYLTHSAAVLDQVADAIDREIPMGKYSYWMNAEWCSWDYAAFIRNTGIRTSSPAFLAILSSSATQ